MKWWLTLVFISFIFLFTAIALVVSQLSFPIITPPRQDFTPKFFDYAGITHAHSALSTGSGSMSELTKAANAAGCHFLIVTDLNPTHKPEGIEGYKDDVVVIWGGEYSFLNGHVLAYGLDEAHKEINLGQRQLLLNDLLDKPARSSKEGILVAAHPFWQDHAWSNLAAPGLSGMEILNLNSVWATQSSQHKWSVLWSILIFPFNSDLSFLRFYRDPDTELGAWDEILKTRRFLGFAGNDSTANAIPLPGKSIKFPRYVQTFRLMKNHLLLKSELTGSYSSDRQKILDALTKGNFYFSVDLIGNPAGFYFTGMQRRQESLPGSELSLNEGPVTFTVNLGRDIGIPHEIILFRNGQQMATSNSDHLTYEARQGGAYRAIVRVIPTLPLPDGKVWFTWIFTNAIRIE